MITRSHPTGDADVLDPAVEYYERSAPAYVAATTEVDLSALRERFARCLPVGGHILDAGSGSGRDTRAFLAMGLQVDAFDASPAMARLSSAATRVPTRIVRFQEFDDVERFDGIWACASLLHVPRAELDDAVRRLCRALRTGGVLYMSFKLGAGEHTTPDGRRFTDMTEQGVRDLVAGVAGLEIEEIWVSGGEGAFHGRGEWVNGLARRTT